MNGFENGSRGGLNNEFLSSSPRFTRSRDMIDTLKRVLTCLLCDLLSTINLRPQSVVAPQSSENSKTTAIATLELNTVQIQTRKDDFSLLLKREYNTQLPPNQSLTAPFEPDYVLLPVSPVIV